MPDQHQDKLTQDQQHQYTAKYGHHNCRLSHIYKGDGRPQNHSQYRFDRTFSCAYTSSTANYIDSSVRSIIIMKVLFVLSLTIVAALAADTWHVQTSNDLSEHRNKCVTELKVPAETVEQYKQWKFEDNEQTHCYIECILNKMGLFDATTGPNVEHLVEQLGQGGDKTAVREKVTKCTDANPNKDSKCTWAWRGFSCFQANNLRLIQASLTKPQ